MAITRENPPPCPFATRQWRQARTWQDAPLPPRRLAGFCSIHRALYPRDLATVSATRRGACACPCVACAGRCVGRGALAASLCHRDSCAFLVFACAWRLAHAACCLLPLFLSFLRVLWPRCVPSVSSCTLRPAVSVRLCACCRGCVVCSSASQRVGTCGLRPESEIVCCAVYLMMIAWSCANSSLLCSWIPNPDPPAIWSLVIARANIRCMNAQYSSVPVAPVVDSGAGTKMRPMSLQYGPWWSDFFLPLARSMSSKLFRAAVR